MSFQLAKEEHAGLDQLPDGRWVYTPINIIGRKKNIPKYLVDEELKDRILRTYSRFKYFAICWSVFFLQLFSSNQWKLFVLNLFTMVAASVFFNYKFTNYCKNLKEFQDGEVK